MRGEGVLRDHSQRRTWSRKRTLNGCEMKRNLDNDVFIDVDSERLDDVIIIDVPESLQHKIGGSSVSRKGKKIKFGCIISIDDDEDVGCSEMGTGVADLESDSSCSKSCLAPEHANKSMNFDDECQVVQKKKYASRASKCEKAFVKDPCCNRYGLFESSSLDSDGSDSEVMEGSSGRLHKEWEKAYLKRKSNAHQGKSGADDQASPSSLNNDHHPDVDIVAEKTTKQHPKTSFCCNSSPKEADFHFGGETFVEDTLSNSSWWQSYKCRDGGGGSSFRDDGQSSPGPIYCSNQEDENKKNHYTRTGDVDKQQNFIGAHFNFQGINGNFHHKNTSFEDREASLCKSQQSSETRDNTEKVVPSEKCDEFSQETSGSSSSLRKSRHTRTVSIEKDKPVSGDPQVSTSRPSCETQAECGVAASEYNDGAVFEESFSRKIPSLGMPEVCDNSGQQETKKLYSEGISLCKTQCTELQSNQGSPCSEEIKKQVICSLSNKKLNGGADPRQTQGVTLTPTSADDIINEREKLKETDEYKRVMEEEWASRQRQLQIQAEEAQRLRKKRRAESMRLLDMERRQKQRLEEIRETQKKDEENMNLKEELRAEVRKELDKLETTCIDMASLLRALGIHVGGSFQPFSHEVQVAYKRALFRFHPDRASKTDVRQQVEAEEKFKLISRMKEKFLLTTCH